MDPINPNGGFPYKTPGTKRVRTVKVPAMIYAWMLEKAGAVPASDDLPDHIVRMPPPGSIPRMLILQNPTASGPREYHIIPENE